MEIRRGNAWQVKNSTKHAFFYDGSESDALYASSFLFEGEQIQIKTSQPHIIEENDDIVVAGKVSKGAFRAYAYHNIDARFSGHENISAKLGFGIMLPLHAVPIFLTFYFFSFGNLTYISISLALFFISLVLGVALIIWGLRIYSAKNILDDWVTQQLFNTDPGIKHK